jgi:type IX secretion system PorP/SprF family membrane protein
LESKRYSTAAIVIDPQFKVKKRHLFKIKFNIRYLTTSMFCFLGLSLLGLSSLNAQDAVFSQFYNIPTTINPAFTGSTYGPYFTAIHRNQWPGIENTYVTYALSYDQYLGEKNSGIGLNILTDNAGGGVLRSTKATGLYSYRLKIKDEYFIKLGLEAGIINTRLDWSQLVFADQLDPQFGLMTPGGTTILSEEIQPSNLSLINLDVSTGILLYTPTYYFGLSAKHINAPENTFFGNEENTSVGIPIRLSIHGAYQFTLRKGNKQQFPTLLSPSILFLKQGSFTQLNIGAQMDFGTLLTGLHYRQSGSTGDAVIASMGMRYDIYKFAYSFDYTVSGLGISTGGSHEVSISVNLDHLYEKPSKYNDCLKVFR